MRLEATPFWSVWSGLPRYHQSNLDGRLKVSLGIVLIEYVRCPGRGGNIIDGTHNSDGTRWRIPKDINEGLEGIDDRDRVMAKDSPPAWMKWFNALRLASLAMIVLIVILWGLSYFVGVEVYRSNWTVGAGTGKERANWAVSNFGSFGLAWRKQDVEFLPGRPDDEWRIRTFGASASALDHVHPEGVAAWHWIDRQFSPTLKGQTRVVYGHLYVPYWMPFLAIGLVYGILRRRAGIGVSRSTPDSASGE